MLTPPAPTIPSTPAPVLLTLPQVAKRMKVSEHTVYNYVMQGRLRAYDYGSPKRSLWRIAPQDVDAFWDLGAAKARAEESIARAGKKQIRRLKVCRT